MQIVEGQFVYSATDLNNELECRYLTELERKVALHELQRPEPEASIALISAKGEAHEQRHLARLQHLHGDPNVVVFATRSEPTLAGMRAAEAATVAAMERGVPIIYQATFFDGTFLGRADFLRRIERPSERWPWSYEVIDTKLALHPKAHYLIQLSNYSEHVARIQGTMPEHAHIVLGSGVERRFRVDDYAAYYRRQKASFLARIGNPAGGYPEETAHCGICAWFADCERRRERDGYLGLVAWMRADQLLKLTANGISDIASLAAATDDQRPLGMRHDTFDTLRAQAKLQHKQRVAFERAVAGAQRYFYELRDHLPHEGFGLLFPPDDGDVFFDMEGDPLYRPDRGLEYLFGVYLPFEKQYVSFWAHSDKEERRAFERFMDFIVERRKRFPNLRIYHYAPYETTALRRLMGRFGTREAELDDLLRHEVFVDLYAVVRQSLRISQKSYSIKKLEPFYGFERTTDVRRGDDSIVQFESWLASGDDEILDDIERYNEEDCRSTYLLREWLLERRAERARTGVEQPWRQEPPPHSEEADEELDELVRRLLDGLAEPLDLDEMRAAEPGVRLRWLLAHLLQYYRREDKPAWWRIFDRSANVDRLLEFDADAIGGLVLREDIAPKKKPSEKTWTYTYEFPDQRHNLDKRPYFPDAEKPRPAGELISIDDETNLLELKLPAAVDPHAVHALFPGAPINTDAQREALRRVATAYLDGTLADAQPATLDLLLARAPRFRDRLPGMPVQPATVTPTAIGELVRDLDGGALFIQGPPGSGKSTTGAAVIAALLEGGKRIGVVSRSHKAVQHLLGKVEREMRARSKRFRGLYKSSGGESAYVSPLENDPMIEDRTTNPPFSTEEHQLAGGTPWLFARAELTGAYDYLFIDEAGQLALADAVACAPCARNVVLLGDPLQLAQVSQGSHPVGTGVSVLEHLLGDDATIPEDRGLFLDVSYRLQPGICAFISEHVYEHRLRPFTRTRTNAVGDRAGLEFLAVAHSGNSRESEEEAAAIVAEARRLCAERVRVDGSAARPMRPADILVVTPYNAQRKLIGRKLAEAGLDGIRVGTVDKFQGQEAPVVFYSMATSSGADVPRDLAFLFEKNRLNVAVSRAQCLSILVCSPRLLDVPCSSPEQMALVNLLCAYAEAAGA
jgi:uncharacterized protein